MSMTTLLKQLITRSTVSLLCLLLSLSCAGEAHARQSTQAAFLPSPDAIKLIERTIDHAKVSIDVAAIHSRPTRLPTH